MLLFLLEYSCDGLYEFRDCLSDFTSVIDLVVPADEFTAVRC